MKAMYSDNEIQALAKKLLVDDIVKHGNMLELSKQNKLRISVVAITSPQQALKLIEIDPLKVIEIEGASINRWSVTRYQVSQSFDLIVERTVSPLLHGSEVKLRNAFFIPHKDGKYQGELFSPSKWQSINFK